MYKNLFFLFLSFLISSVADCQVGYTPPTEQSVAQKVANLPQHPRILLLKQDEAALKDVLKNDPLRQKLHQAILDECNKMLSLPPVERIQIGRRLLDKSRECLRRVFQLSYAYRTTGNEAFLKRAEKELVAVASFSDWNPSHFLDVAEMTMAVAIGYDWLYENLSAETRQQLRTAIIEKGINPSFDKKHNGFLNSAHNWNQVCNAGMTFGALAIAEDDPELATRIIHRALETTPKSMAPYAPNGAYPEGYGYWGYGTSFNVLLISSLEAAMDTDFGLANIPGFLDTGGFLQNMIGPNKVVHNWGDSGLTAGLSPAMFWFAERTGDESLLWFQKQFLEADPTSSVKNRLLPTALIWGRKIDLNLIKSPTSLLWYGQGPSPVALMRTSWTDPEALFVGFKVGSASVNHAHMDVGSFVLDAWGERWAMDFGMQNYHSLESKGVQLWGRAQDAQRWRIFRYNNFVHNTLTIDEQLHKVDGYAKIDGVSDNPEFLSAISDLSEVFGNQAQAVKRGVAIRNKRSLWVRDEIKAPERELTVRWTLLTPADVKIISKNTIELSQNGKKMYVHFKSENDFVLKTWSTEPPNDYDAPNPGTTLAGLETSIPAGKNQSISVVFSGDRALTEVISPLSEWPMR